MAKRDIYVLTQGDDLGGSYSANKAIHEAWRNGLLRNGSLMANGIAVQDASRLFAQEKDFCIGLHCTLHSEWDNVRWGPVLPPDQVPSLVLEDGTLHRSPADWLASGYEISEVMAELQAQLEAIRALGFRPFYADTHMGFDRVDDGLKDAFDRWCESEGLLSYRNICTDLSMSGPGPEDLVEKLIHLLDHAAPGIYRIITHPTFNDEEIQKFGNNKFSGAQIAKERDDDRKLFQDDRLKRYFEQNGVLPIRYDEVMSCSRSRKRRSPSKDTLPWRLMGRG